MTKMKINKKKADIKALRKEAFLGSIKFYDIKKYQPKLLPIDHPARRYQEQSRPCIVYWKWSNPINRTKQEDPRFATLYKTGWQVSGITGTFEILSWAYLPNEPITP